MAVTFQQMAADTFTRANAGTLGANWLNQLSGLQIVSNTAEATVASTLASAIYSGTQGSGFDFPINQYAECKIVATVGASCIVSPAVRMTFAANGAVPQGINGYFLSVDGSKHYTLVREISSVLTTLATSTQTVVVNDVVRLYVIGNSFSVNVNGLPVALLQNIVDNSFAYGWPGLVIQPDATLTDAQATNWQAGGVFNAATVVNSSMLPIVSMQATSNLGTISTANTAVQFSLNSVSQKFMGRLQIVASGGFVQNPQYILMASQDAGASWFQVPAGTVPTNAATLGQTPSAYASWYDIMGMANCIFQFGLLSGTVINNVTVHAMVA